MIIYINGYKGENSNKPQILSEMLNKNVHHLKFNMNNYEEMDDFIRSNNVELVIASSTGAYAARSICYQNNLPLVSLNPVIEIKETFLKLQTECPNIPQPENYSIEHLVLLNKDDELIPYKQSFEYFKDKAKIITAESGGHRMSNLVYFKEDILKFMEKIF